MGDIGTPRRERILIPAEEPGRIPEQVPATPEPAEIPERVPA